MRALVLAGMIACAPSSRPYYVNFIPFGAGQYQNGERIKGTAFAVGEGAAAATSVGLWLYLSTHYKDGVVPPADAQRARSLEVAELGTGVAFFVMYGWGVVDALWHVDTSAMVAPVPVQGGAALAATWRY